MIFRDANLTKTTKFDRNGEPIYLLQLMIILNLIRNFFLKVVDEFCEKYNLELIPKPFAHILKK